MGKRSMPEDWRPSIGCIVKLKQRYGRVDLEWYIEEARDYALANGKQYANFDAYFRNWMKRAASFGMLRHIPDERPLAVVHDIGEKQANPLSRADALEKFK